MSDALSGGNGQGPATMTDKRSCPTKLSWAYRTTGRPGSLSSKWSGSLLMQTVEDCLQRHRFALFAPGGAQTRADLAERDVLLHCFDDQR
jgi:hypothetical protein